MNNSIPYLVKNGDTLESIAKELGITDPYDLRNYHNMNAEIKDGIGPEPPAGKTLLTPSAEKIKEINAKRAAYNEEEKIETEKKEQEKQEEQKQQQKEQKEQEQKEKQTAQSAHDNKYFVVNGALCCCDKAENPKQTAKLIVTSHKKVILNAEAGKYFATEADKTFDPAAATFGKCTLRPSSGGNLPCALSPAPKWSTVFEKTKVMGNCVLTEISTLQCTVGGKIEVAQYGQTNTVMKEHAENTNPAALALINQAIEIPKLKTAYPSVSSIALKSLKNNPDFKAVSSGKSKNVEKVMVRPNQECTFEAKVGKGNVNLTSWVIYDGFNGDKDKRLYTEEQIGTQFKYTFPAEGKYRIEGYGQPKKVDAETADYKSYPDCCLDIEVALNKLQGNELEPIDGENFSKIIQGKMRLRKDFPASFKARFLMPPTEEELENLKMYVTDASGNSLKSVKIENTVSFTPINTNAKYNFHASYKLPSGEVQTQIFSGETIGNAITGITHPAHVIRRGTSMTFAVSASRFSFYIPDEQEVIAKEAQSVKWNLNGRLMGTGKGITIPGHEFMNLGKYVVEAYVTLANAYGTNAKDEEDDWRFEVKDNDVKSFSYSGIPKVGKTTFLEADNLIFPKLIANETIVWDTTIPHKTIDEKTISITPLKAGKELVNCRINREPGKTLSIDVKQGKVLGMLFTDSTGIEIEKSSWYQTVNIWVKQEHLIGEDLTIEIWDKDKITSDDYCKVINVKEYDGNLIPLTLDSYIKRKAGDWGSLYVKIGAPKLKLANPNNIFESKNRLDVQDKREIYSAQIGTQDGKERHYHADYNKISYFYAKSRGIKAGEKLKITIYEKGKKLFDATDVSVDTSGLIKATLKWDSINQKLPSRVVHAVVIDSENKILYEGNKTANGGVHITKTSALLGLAEYKSAVLVKKSESSVSKINNKNCACECEAKIRAFLRMLRVGEGTGELIKSWDKKTKEIIYIDHDFQEGYRTAFGGNIILDLNDHPKTNYGGSTAAGAYQIMEYTYAWLGGSKLEWTGKYFKILDIYESYHDYRKKYNIKDYQPESQDRLCICLMKDKKGLIELIIDDKIEESIRKYGSHIWASLPSVGDNSYHDYNGKPQPATPMKKCIEHYNKFLKAELSGISNLHLKKGFLKDFYSPCCNRNEIKSVEGKDWNIDIHLWANRKEMGYGILVLKK